MFAKCVTISTDEWDLTKKGSRSEKSSLHSPRHKSQDEKGTIESTKVASLAMISPLSESYSSGDLAHGSPNKMNPGERLHSQAPGRSKNIEIQRQRRQFKSQQTCSDEQQKPRLCNYPTIQLDDEARRARLYGIPKEKQAYGKKRREEVAKASIKRNALPKPEDFGKLPKSKTDNMYVKGVKALRQKQSKIAKEYEKKQEKIMPTKHYGKISQNKADNMYLKGLHALILKEQKIAEKQHEKIEGEIAMHRFKLAEGAFALNPDPDLKKRTIDSDTTACSSGYHFSSSEDESLGL